MKGLTAEGRMSRPEVCEWQRDRVISQEALKNTPNEQEETEGRTLRG